MDEIVLEDTERNIQIIKKNETWYQLIFTGLVTKVYSYSCFEDAYENYFDKTSPPRRKEVQ